MTVTLDDADSNSSPDITKQSNTDTNGAWSVSLTSDEIRTLQPGTVTVTATAESARATRTVTYEPPKPKTGKYAINGIDLIPSDILHLSNRQMQQFFVTAELQVISHAQIVRYIACESYITPCEDSESFSGKTRNPDGTVTVHTGTATPYSSFTSSKWPIKPSDLSNRDWVYDEIVRMGTARIVVYATSPSGTPANRNGADLPFLQVSSMGNVNPDNGLIRYPIDDFARVGDFGRIPEAVKADKTLLIAGWHRDQNGDYTRHSSSIACGPYVPSVAEGCLWARLSFDEGNGTSLSGPNVGAALASILAAFPDTTDQNLARLAKACADKDGNGIEELLREFHGVGVADFGCMGPITEVRENLPPGATTRVIIDGKTVRVSERELVVR